MATVRSENGIWDIVKAPIKTGKEQGMQESYMKGIANHHGPDSCLDQQQWGGEALTGVRVQVWDKYGTL